MTSDHFRVYTNLGSAEASEAAAELERARKSLLFAWQYRVDPPGRIDTVILQNTEQLHEFVPDLTEAFVTRDTDGLLIALPGNVYQLGSASTDLRVVMHELAHYLSSFVLFRQPRWIAEGLASYLETTRPYGSDGEEVRMGEANANLLYWAKTHARVPLEELWRWDASGELNQAELTSYYASSWLWVHFLINKHPDRFAAFQESLARAEEPRQGWERAFGGLDKDELQKELNGYLARGTYSAFRFPQPQTNTASTERLMSEADVHALRARLTIVGNRHAPKERVEKAQAELSAAFDRDPTHFGAHLSKVTWTASSVDRVERARALAGLHPNRAGGWLTLASSLMGNEDAAAERREAAVKAVQLEPDHVEALNVLAWDYVTTGNFKAALPIAQKAVRLAPWDSAVIDTYAAALAGSGRCKDALAAQRRAIEMLHERVSNATRADYDKRRKEYEAGCRNIHKPEPATVTPATAPSSPDAPAAKESSEIILE